MVVVKYFGFVFVTCVVWFLLHTAFGGEEQCFKELHPDSHPIGCSTILQFLAMLFLSIIIGILILMTPSVIKLLPNRSLSLARKISIIFWSFIILCAGLWQTMSISDYQPIGRAFQLGLFETSIPFLSGLLLVGYVEFRFKNITSVVT